MEEKLETINGTIKEDEEMKYTIRKTYKYTELVHIEADSREEALVMAENTEGERQYDDYLYDCEAGEA